MKRALFVLFTLVIMVGSASAQNNAIGFRLGAGSGYNAEVSYQNWLSDSHRLECDLGGTASYAGGINALAASAIFQWHWYIVENFGWYVGPGAVASVSFANPTFGLGIGGQIGLDYQFNIPLQLSLDVRPMWNFLGYVTGAWWGASIGVRYAF